MCYSAYLVTDVVSDLMDFQKGIKGCLEPADRPFNHQLKDRK